MWKMTKEIRLIPHLQLFKMQTRPWKEGLPSSPLPRTDGWHDNQCCPSSCLKNGNLWLGLQIARGPWATGLTSLVLSFFMSKMEIIKPGLWTAFSSLCISFSSPNDVDDSLSPQPFWRVYAPPPKAYSPLPIPQDLPGFTTPYFLLQEGRGPFWYCVFGTCGESLDPTHCGKNDKAVVLKCGCPLHATGKILKSWQSGSTPALRFWFNWFGVWLRHWELKTKTKPQAILICCYVWWPLC